ncbi:monovalent cation/H+ antiporter subunit D [Microvirga mediterraneensis]|uniref:Monovalent cation/H+ antiporter subunit D n=1 Tax=Microvirga mediterraneensis TaxID=2754695 RepID=A0A838BQF4_9HYPH|nr:monovalent cation/H+ antiporter subunit D [Microvirga mediterraneensis]MBA1157600.1 monovalent cation/H+ antiporter subunit D [Microvirga mediterraneensis]
MKDAMDHLIIVPIVLPLISGALMLLLEERSRSLKGGIGIATTVILLIVSLVLLQQADETAPGTGLRTYQLGNWPAPFGIVLVLDRLSALMLVLTSVLGLATLLYALARWHRAGPRFHTIFQIQLMGLNGAFLTGDLFNLFVFFEVLLAASYGLVLHGDGKARVRAGLAYIAINLTASLLFLIGASLAYGVTGTLNMADLASRVPGLAPGDASLLAASAAILGTAFLMKAGTWPLNFWLPTTYAAAAAPAAAMFAIMSKLGVYVILRLWSLVFGPEAGSLAGFGGDWLLMGGMLTIVFGMVGVLASQSLPRLAGCSVLVSSGTLVAAIGLGNGSVIGSALFYLVSSTLGIAALFLLVELVERLRDPGADVLAVTMEVYGDSDEELEAEIGVAIPATIALLGGSFIACALLLAGLPPLSGFVAKFGMMAAMLKTNGASVPASAWVLIALLTVSGLATLIAMTRSGITSFWARMSDSVPRVRIIEMAPVVALLLLALGLTIGGGPAMRYMEATAQALQAPQGYMSGVLSPPKAGDGAAEARP